MAFVSVLSSPSCALIIPLYNKQGQILRALASVIQQQPAFNQVLIVDDCSTDASVSLVEQFILAHPAAGIRLIRREQNGGPGAARNTGLELLDCDYACFLDADDFLAPTASADLQEALQSCVTPPGLMVFRVNEQGSDIVRPNFQRLAALPGVQEVASGLLKLDDWPGVMVEETLFCSGGNVLIGRALAHCRFDPALRNFEDWEFYFRLCEQARRASLDIVVSAHVGLTYTVDDDLSLSRAPTVGVSLRNPPSLVSNVDLPLEVRRFTAGVWLCHVAQRSTLRQGLPLFWKALIQPGGARPTFGHLCAAIFGLLFGRNVWASVSKLRKRLRYRHV